MWSLSKINFPVFELAYLWYDEIVKVKRLDISTDMYLSSKILRPYHLRFDVEGSYE